MNRIKRHNFINQLCWYILLFFGLFDAARNYTYLPFWFGYLKDIAIFTLLLFNIQNIKIRKDLGIMFYIMICLIFLQSFQGILSSRLSIIDILFGTIKYLEFFILVLLFRNWNSIFSISLNHALKQYVYIGVPILIAVNIIGYYIPNPIVSRLIWNGRVAKGFYGGRITVGQPPIAIYPVLISFIYLLIYDKRVLRLAIYLGAIILALSNTGVLALIIVTIIIGIYEIFMSNNRKETRKFLVIMCLFSVMAITVQPIIEAILPNHDILYTARIDNFLRGKDLSMSGRELHWEKAMGRLDSVWNKIFGKGMYGYYDWINSYNNIENMYVTMYCAFGLVGIITWIFMWIIFLKKDFLKILKYRDRDMLMSICLIIVYLIHMYTLDTMIVYTITLNFALFYASTHENKISSSPVVYKVLDFKDIRLTNHLKF